MALFLLQFCHLCPKYIGMTVYSEWWIFHLFELQEIETYFAEGKKLSNCVMWLNIHFAPQAYFSEQRALNLGFSQPGSHHHSVTASTGPVFGGRKWRGSSTTETVSTTELMMEWWLGLGGSAKRLMRGNRDEREPALSKASSRVDRAFFL